MTRNLFYVEKAKYFSEEIEVKDVMMQTAIDKVRP